MPWACQARTKQDQFTLGRQLTRVYRTLFPARILAHL